MNISLLIHFLLCIFKASNEHANCDVPTTEKLILDDYFLNKYKPKKLLENIKSAKKKFIESLVKLKSLCLNTTKERYKMIERKEQ